MSRFRLNSTLAVALTTLALAGCGATAQKPKSATDGPVATTTTTTSTSDLPGNGKPPLVIGDKNFTEQFILGELYAEALTAQGYTVTVNRNIGPTEVTVQALESGRLAMYPEYVGVWDSAVAHYRHRFHTAVGALRAARRYAARNKLTLLDATPFSDTEAIAVTLAYADHNRLRSLSDLRRVASTMTLGGPLEFEQRQSGLPAVEQAYGFAPAGFRPLDIGSQYAELDNGSIQAADVNTTDGQLGSGDYLLLSDPRQVFGWGQAVPVVPDKVIAAEGPAFAATIDQVTALLTRPTIRWLNDQVDVAHRDPTSVARQFLETHGIIPPSSSS